MCWHSAPLNRVLALCSTTAREGGLTAACEFHSPPIAVMPQMSSVAALRWILCLCVLALAHAQACSSPQHSLSFSAAPSSMLPVQQYYTSFTLDTSQLTGSLDLANPKLMNLVCLLGVDAPAV